MQRFKLTHFFYKFRFLQFFYKYEFIKRLYKAFFVSWVPNQQYYVELSNKCNAECIFCTYPILRDRGKPQINISDDFFAKIVYLMETQKRSSISLTPTTGEIFMNPRWNEYVQKILDLDFVQNVRFYTNGALLNTKNREKFFQLKNLQKMSVSFSTGGADRETYQLMFGKDLFQQVKDNINTFLNHLKSHNFKMAVSIDIKLAQSTKLSLSVCQEIYDPCHYQYAFFKIRHTFDTFHGLIQNDNIEPMKSAPLNKRTHPCNYLNDIRFAANGGVWLCGCVISELPEHEELRVGNLTEESNLLYVLEKQKKIQTEWLKDGKVPYPCQECTWYAAK